MKYKKLFVVLALLFVFIPTLLKAQDDTTPTCNDNAITIESITLEEKSDDVTEVAQPTIEGKKINLNLKIKNLNDSIKYKLVVKNNSEEDYAVATDINDSTNYVTYTYSSNEQGNVISAGSSRILYLTVTYKNQVPASAFSGGTYTDNKDLVIDLSTDITDPNADIGGNTSGDTIIYDDTPVVNPKTGVSGTILFIIVALFIAGIVYAVFKSKSIKHLVIIAGLMTLVPLTIYAVCSCQLSVDSKVTIEYTEPETPPVTPDTPVEDVTSIQSLKNHVVTSGQGLYVDSTTTNRYVFKGRNPDNYVKFGSEVFRIISIEPDNSLKLIRLSSIGTIPFDPGYTNEIAGITEVNSLVGTRGNNSGDICYSSTSNNFNGCKVWAGNNSNSVYKVVNGNASLITTFPKVYNSNAFNLPGSDSYLNTYLNGGTFQGNSITGWYSSLNSAFKTFISEHYFNIGPVEYVENQTVQTDIIQEKEYLWKGKVGLMNPSDYVLASTNSSCTGLYSYTTLPECYNNSSNHNYLAQDNEHEWTINPISISNNSRVWSIDTDNNFDNAATSSANNSYQVRPVIFVKGSIITSISGAGTYSSPYVFGN